MPTSTLSLYEGATFTYDYDLASVRLFVHKIVILSSDLICNLAAWSLPLALFEQPTFVDLDADGHLDLVVMFNSIGAYYRNVPSSNGSANYVVDVTIPSACPA